MKLVSWLIFFLKNSLENCFLVEPAVFPAGKFWFFMSCSFKSYLKSKINIFYNSGLIRTFFLNLAWTGSRQNFADKKFVKSQHAKSALCSNLSPKLSMSARASNVRASNIQASNVQFHRALNVQFEMGVKSLGVKCPT